MFEPQRPEHTVSYDELMIIISEAAKQYPKVRLPMVIGPKTLEHSEAVNTLLLESFIMYLNRKGLLNKLVKFDHTRQV